VPLTILAAVSAGISAVKKGCELYKEAKSAAGNVKEIIDDLKKQFNRGPKTKEAKQQLDAEIIRVKETAQLDSNHVTAQIGRNLGEVFDQIGKLQEVLAEEERKAHEVYTGSDSAGKRAMQLVLLRSQLDMMYADLRQEMVYNTPPELKDLWTRCEKRWNQLVEEQKDASAAALRNAQKARWRKQRVIRDLKEKATWAGAILFVVAWLVGVLILIRTSQTYRGF